MATKGRTFDVLVVDNEQKICDIVKVFLSLSSHFNNIVTANSAVEAMTKMQNQKFDLLVVDQVMPGKKGVELIDNVQKMLSHKHLKVLLMSGCLQKQDVIEAMNIGVKHILVKPFSRDDLLRKVAELLDVTF